MKLKSCNNSQGQNFQKKRLNKNTKLSKKQKGRWTADMFKSAIKLNVDVSHWNSIVSVECDLFSMS